MTAPPENVTLAEVRAAIDDLQMVDFLDKIARCAAPHITREYRTVQIDRFEAECLLKIVAYCRAQPAAGRGETWEELTERIAKATAQPAAPVAEAVGDADDRARKLYEPDDYADAFRGREVASDLLAQLEWLVAHAQNHGILPVALANARAAIARATHPAPAAGVVDAMALESARDFISSHAESVRTGSILPSGDWPTSSYGQTDRAYYDKAMSIVAALTAANAASEGKSGG